MNGARASRPTPAVQPLRSQSRSSRGDRSTCRTGRTSRPLIDASKRGGASRDGRLCTAQVDQRARRPDRPVAHRPTTLSLRGSLLRFLERPDRRVRPPFARHLHPRAVEECVEPVGNGGGGLRRLGDPRSLPRGRARSSSGTTSSPAGSWPCSAATARTKPARPTHRTGTRTTTVRTVAMGQVATAPMAIRTMSPTEGMDQIAIRATMATGMETEMGMRTTRPTVRAAGKRSGRTAVRALVRRERRAIGGPPGELISYRGTRKRE